jgi:hypothetical protein
MLAFQDLGSFYLKKTTMESRISYWPINPPYLSTKAH